MNRRLSCSSSSNRLRFERDEEFRSWNSSSRQLSSWTFHLQWGPARRRRRGKVDCKKLTNNTTTNRCQTTCQFLMMILPVEAKLPPWLLSLNNDDEYRKKKIVKKSLARWFHTCADDSPRILHSIEKRWRRLQQQPKTRFCKEYLFLLMKKKLKSQRRRREKGNKSLYFHYMHQDGVCVCSAFILWLLFQCSSAPGAVLESHTHTTPTLHSTQQVAAPVVGRSSTGSHARFYKYIFWFRSFFVCCVCAQWKFSANCASCRNRSIDVGSNISLF